MTDTLLEDIFPRPESPYVRDTMIAVAALRMQYHTQDISFLLADNLF
ncbi:MAG: hypothetical protein J5I41_06730 [Saprospiraceae bacterium]|nr:hypothetical protein [Saprospiraceae bacterium]